MGAEYVYYSVYMWAKEEKKVLFKKLVVNIGC